MNAASAQCPVPSAQWRPTAISRGMPTLTLLAILVACVASLPWTMGQYSTSDLHAARTPPGGAFLFGSDLLGRSLAARALLGLSLIHI